MASQNTLLCMYMSLSRLLSIHLKDLSWGLNGVRVRCWHHRLSLILHGESPKLAQSFLTPKPVDTDFSLVLKEMSNSFEIIMPPYVNIWSVEPVKRSVGDMHTHMCNWFWLLQYSSVEKVSERPLAHQGVFQVINCSGRASWLTAIASVPISIAQLAVMPG